jgi:glycine/D-amino acid oxidase-like deaminating enzyme
MAHQNDPRLNDHRQTLRSLGVELQDLDPQALRRRYPQIQTGPDIAAIFEPQAGVLMARQCVQAVVSEFRRLGGQYQTAQAPPPLPSKHLTSITLSNNSKLQADQYLYACGPWLQKLLPNLLGKKIYPTRQVVFFYGPPPGDNRWSAPAMPAWGDAFSDLPWYGTPDLESRGFKLAFGWLGEDFDPDLGPRQPTTAEIDRARAYLRSRFPALADAPLVETRVCQYENTSNSDFLLDRHPDFDNVWLAGGGSGHGFKHSPAVGEYMAARIQGLPNPEPAPRFSLSSKGDDLPARTRQRP